MTAVVGPLQLDHHQPGLLVHAQQVDPPPGIGEVAELLGDHEQAIADHADVLPQRPLQVHPLQHPLRRERRLRHLDQRPRAQVEQTHSALHRSNLHQESYDGAITGGTDPQTGSVASTAAGAHPAI